MKNKIFIIVAVLLGISVICYLLYVFNIIPHGRYTNEDFGITTFVSAKDQDADGVDDQTDILASAREYLGTKPKYKSKYYATGYPDDEYGVCTDVVAFALRGAGYDLQELVDADIRAHQSEYGIDVVDKNIDFRRVNNLKNFFNHHAESLTTDIQDIAAWQGSDIVVFKDHIGIISDVRNHHGVPFLIHHESPWQMNYEEDVLERRKNAIIGHYRMGTKKLFAQYFDHANDLLQDMSLAEKVAQMFLVRFPDNDELVENVAARPGGFILFAKDFQNETPNSLRDKLQNLQNEQKIKFIFGVDEEGGTVTRVSRFPAFREHQFASPQELYEQGGMDLIVSDAHEKSVLLKNLGINMNLAPVADVPTQKRAFMYDRSFGQNATETANYVREVVQAMNSDGMISVMKHFPGYGDNADTHTGVAIDERAYVELENADLLSFKSGIRADGPVILVSHNIVESMDDTRPASLSRKVHEILREKLGFTGVIMTDDLAMAAVQKYSTNGEAAVDAVMAGNDLIITSDFLKQQQEVLDAVQSGKIPESQINGAAKRVLAMKLAYGIIE